jgi:hypothetical protein
MESQISETKFIGTFANGDYNDELEIDAEEDGLQFSNGIFISWEWIDQARRAVLLLGGTTPSSNFDSGIADRESSTPP